MSDHPLLRNPRRIVPPSQKFGLDKWRRLPVEGQGRPLGPPPVAQRPAAWLLLAMAAYFVVRMLP